MRYFFSLLLFITISTHPGFTAEKSATYTSVDSVRIQLSYTIMYNQINYDYYTYPLIVHLYNRYTPDSLQVDPVKYKNKLNDFYYKRYYLYSKLIDKNALVTADCMKEEETGKWNEMTKLFFHSIYEGPTWEFPADYVKRMEEYSTEDSFYGPVQALIDIYFLKQYNWNRLTTMNKNDLKDLENRYCNDLFSGYIKDKDWGYKKLYALWAIRINENPVAVSVNIKELTDYFDRKNWMIRFAKDYENIPLMKREGGQYTTSISNLCTFWLFTLDR